MTPVLVGASVLVGCVGRIPVAASGPAGGSPPPSPLRESGDRIRALKAGLGD
jgi:hypothetical protein